MQEGIVTSQNCIKVDEKLIQLLQESEIYNDFANEYGDDAVIGFIEYVMRESGCDVESALRYLSNYFSACYLGKEEEYDIEVFGDCAFNMKAWSQMG